MGKNFENTIGSAPHVYSITAPPAYYIPFFIVRKRSYFIYNSDNSRGTNQ